MSLEYKPSLGFVETAGLVIAIQVADAMAKAAEVEIISAHKVDGLRVCVICKGDVAACQAAVETGALLEINGLNGYNIIPSPLKNPTPHGHARTSSGRRPPARPEFARMAAAKAKQLLPPPKSPQGQGKVVVSRNRRTDRPKRCRPARIRRTPPKGIGA
ncbi:MAG: BMC domain-containing protein [Bilophila wadsworthia]